MCFEISIVLRFGGRFGRNAAEPTGSSRFFMFVSSVNEKHSIFHKHFFLFLEKLLTHAHLFSSPPFILYTHLWGCWKNGTIFFQRSATGPKYKPTELGNQPGLVAQWMSTNARQSAKNWTNVSVSTTSKIPIDQIHLSRNAPVPYPAMHHWEQTWEHFCLNYGLWDLCDFCTFLFRMVYYGTWDRSIVGCLKLVQRKHQSSASLAFVRGIHRWPVNSLHKGPGPCITNVIATCRKNFSQWESSFLWKLRYHWLKFLRRVAKTLVIQGPVTRKMFPFDNVIMHFWCLTTKCSKPCFLIEPLQQEGICEHGWMWIETAVVINRFDEMKASHYRDVIMSVISNHRRLDCLLNRLFKHRSKKTLKLRVTGLCEGNSPVTDEFPTQRPSNAEN